MSNILVSYFSASGNTRRVALKLAEAIGADLFEIEPVDKYTDADLDWTNVESRTTIEMKDRMSRPKIKIVMIRWCLDFLYGGILLQLLLILL